jgi:hypothetical protein
MWQYFGTAVTNQNGIHEEIKSSLISGNVRRHLIQNSLSSHRLSKYMKNKTIYKPILPLVLYGYGTWYLTLKEGYRLQVFENKVLRKLVESMREEVSGRETVQRWCS